MSADDFNLDVIDMSEKEVWLDYNCLLTAFGGMGKTYALAFMPGPILILDTDRSHKTLRGSKGIKVLEITCYSQLLKVTQVLIAKAEAGKLKYRTVCIDGLTELQKMLFAEEMTIDGVMKSETKHGSEYNVAAYKMLQILRSLRDIPGLNLVCTAAIKDPKETGARYPIDVPGQLMGALSLFFETVILINVIKRESGELQRVYLTQPDDHYNAKIRKPFNKKPLPKHLLDISQYVKWQDQEPNNPFGDKQKEPDTDTKNKGAKGAAKK